MIHAHFIVATKAPGFVEPPESSVYDPALGKNLETFGAVTAANYLQAQFPKGAQLLNPLHKGTQVAATRQDELQAAKHADQELDQPLGRIPILYGGRRNHNRQNQSQTIHRHVPLASGDFLARVVAALSALIRGFNRLAIDDGGGRRNVAAFGLAHVVAQGVVNKCPSPILAPASVITVDGLPRTKVPGQQSPGTASANHVKHRVDQAATVQRGRSPTFALSGFRSWYQQFDIFPFFATQVSWISSRMRLHPIHL